MPLREGPVQIVDVNPEGDGFTLHEKKLKYILDQIPPDLKISVVSIVGAFRTGKSFLLDLILRYLHRDSSQSPSPPGTAAWLNAEGAAVPGHGDAPEHVAADASEGTTGFKWRGGEERTTTGICLWSRPFIMPLPGGDGENVAVLIMDTQGMFDGHTSQMLTTSIFAISTLISSHQIYNLLGHVQEDNLQQLALFSAYGKCVQEQQSELEEAEGLAAATPSAGPQRPPPPFQRVELLVRDSPRITTFMPKAGAGGLWPVGTDPSWAPVDAECERQLESILSRGANADLVSVRAQIKDCFAEVSLAMLPNPGMAVVEDPEYAGELHKIRPEFRAILQRYVEKLFEERLIRKLINGRPVTARQLSGYITAYCSLFKEKTGLPETQLLLQATAEASNRNAADTALDSYKSAMDSFCRSYRDAAELKAHHAVAAAAALDLFDEKANFGPFDAIDRAREMLAAELDSTLLPDYLQRNRERNPMGVLGPVLTALGVALAAWIIRQLVEMTCAPWLDVCMRTSQLMGFVYSAILLVLAGLAYAQRSALRAQFGFLVPVAQQLYRTALAGSGAQGPASTAAPSPPPLAPPSDVERSSSQGAGRSASLRLRRQASSRAAK